MAAWLPKEAGVDGNFNNCADRIWFAFIVECVKISVLFHYRRNRTFFIIFDSGIRLGFLIFVREKRLVFCKY